MKTFEELMEVAYIDMTARRQALYKRRMKASINIKQRRLNEYEIR